MKGETIKPVFIEHKMTPLSLADELDKKINDACIFPYEVVLKHNDASRISYALRCLHKQKQRLETELYKRTQFNTQLYPLTDEEIGLTANEIYGEFNWSKRALDFAKAILRKAQEK